MKAYIILTVTIVLVVFGCSDEQLDITTTDTVVIEGYLYTGQSIDSLKISQLIPLIIDSIQTEA